MSSIAKKFTNVEKLLLLEIRAVIFINKNHKKMSKSWKPKLPKEYQLPKLPKLPNQFDPFKMPKQFDPFKYSKEPKKEVIPHIITEYEKQLIYTLSPVIKNKQLIRFWYCDETTSFEDWRLVEPHLIGQTKFKTGNIMLRAWFLPTQQQIFQGHQEDWKVYILDRISKVEILTKIFTKTRPYYNPQDKDMKTIFCATYPRI